MIHWGMIPHTNKIMSYGSRYMFLVVLCPPSVEEHACLLGGSTPEEDRSRRFRRRVGVELTEYVEEGNG